MNVSHQADIGIAVKIKKRITRNLSFILATGVLCEEKSAFFKETVYKKKITLDEIKKLSPAYVDKFGDKFKGLVSVPTLKELLTLAKEKNPSLRLGVEIKQYTEETVDLTARLLKEYGFFDDCWFYAFNGRIISYIKKKYNGRTMGYPAFQMGEFEGYDNYDEIGLSMGVLRSEDRDTYLKMGLPTHMFCADTEDDVNFCLSLGASLITANDPRPLMKILSK